MNKFPKYFLFGLIIILLSSPLGHISTNLYNSFTGNLVGAYELILDGFIVGFRLIGVLIACIGIMDIIFNKISKLLENK